MPVISNKSLLYGLQQKLRINAKVNNTDLLETVSDFMLTLSPTQY